MKMKVKYLRFSNKKKVFFSKQLWAFTFVVEQSRKSNRVEKNSLRSPYRE